MSACVKWAKEHVDLFNVLLVRQLSSVEEGGGVWEECMTQARQHASMLREVGLDFEGLVGEKAEVDTRVVGLGVS
jgi:hypothetical protein